MINLKNSNMLQHQVTATCLDREQRNNHKGAILCFKGLSSAGKYTLAQAFELGNWFV